MRQLLPRRTIPIIGIDANGHVGLSRDKVNKTFSPTISASIGPENPEKGNHQGAILREFLERTNFVALNTFFPTGETYYAQSSDAETRIDYLLVPASLLSSGRAPETSIMERLGDTSQHVCSQHRADHFPMGFSPPH